MKVVVRFQKLAVMSFTLHKKSAVMTELEDDDLKVSVADGIPGGLQERVRMLLSV